MSALKDIDNGTKLKIKTTYLLTEEKVKNNVSNILWTNNSHGIKIGYNIALRWL